MTLEEIFSEWEKDSEIDSTNLHNESLNIPKLHHKYYKMFSNEKLVLKKLESDLVEFKRLKQDYYSGVMDYDTLKELGWSPNPLKILRGDIQHYIHSDKDIVQKNLKIAVQQEKVELLQDIIKTIHTRNFVIKSSIDFMRFQSGG